MSSTLQDVHELSDWRLDSALMHRVERWARNNPDEWITAEDAAAKFDCTPDQFKCAVRNLRKVGRSCMEAVIVWRPRGAE